VTRPVVERPFAAGYTVEVVDDVPAGADVVELVRSGPTPAFTIEVATEAGGWWAGVVLSGRPPVARALQGVWTTPSPATACVIAAGEAVLVDVDEPAEGAGRLVPGDPFTSVRAAADDGLLLLASPWTITAIGADGVRWTTARLAIDGLRLDEVDGGRLAGVSDPDDGEGGRDFVVDLATGAHEGGTPVA
jgi:hypothetical protein